MRNSTQTSPNPQPPPQDLDSNLATTAAPPSPNHDDFEVFSDGPEERSESNSESETNEINLEILRCVNSLQQHIHQNSNELTLLKDTITKVDEAIGEMAVAQRAMSTEMEDLKQALKKLSLTLEDCGVVVSTFLLILLLFVCYHYGWFPKTLDLTLARIFGPDML